MTHSIDPPVADLHANYGSLIMSVDIHAAISRLRYLSEEFREARRIPAEERREVAVSIGMRANEILLKCWHLGCLRSIPSLQEFFGIFKKKLFC